MKGANQKGTDKGPRRSMASKATEELYERSQQMYLPTPVTTVKINDKPITPRPPKKPIHEGSWEKEGQKWRIASNATSPATSNKSCDSSDKRRRIATPSPRSRTARSASLGNSRLPTSPPGVPGDGRNPEAEQQQQNDESQPKRAKSEDRVLDSTRTAVVQQFMKDMGIVPNIPTKKRAKHEIEK